MSKSFLETHQTTILIVVSSIVGLALVYYIYKSTYGLKEDVNLIQERCTDYEQILKQHDMVLQQVVGSTKPTLRPSKTRQHPTVVLTSVSPQTKYKPVLETIIEEEEENDEELDREVEEELKKLQEDESSLKEEKEEEEKDGST
jgi:hypothetical protein